MLENINNMLQSISNVQQRINQIEQKRSMFSSPGNSGTTAKEQPPDSAKNQKFSQSLGKQRLEPGGDLDSTLKRVARNEGVDEDLVRSVIQVESGFDPKAVSSDGAQGLMQLLPSTAQMLGIDPMDPKQNLEGGIKYLGRMMDQFGNLEEALAAYNAGPDAVEEHGGVPPFSETQDYVKRVTELYRQ